MTITLLIIGNHILNQFINVYPIKYLIYARGNNLLKRFLFAKASIVKVNTLYLYTLEWFKVGLLLKNILCGDF